MIPQINERLNSEILNWKDTIAFSLQELQKHEEELTELDYQNKIKGIIADKEHFLTAINLMRQRILKIKSQVRLHENILKELGVNKNNISIYADLISSQNNLRQSMQNMETDYLILKYSFQIFYIELHSDYILEKTDL